VIETHREHAVTGSSDRSFGIVLGVFFVVIALWPLVSGGAVRLWAFAVAALFLLPAVFFPRVLAPLNKAWTALGLVLGRVVSPVALAVLFYLVITPMGLVIRAAGKRLMRVQPEASVSSYWIRREPPGPAPESFPNQF
jgi:hypothetical protein